ncbi:hypothetical protein J3458_000784 [Metarhizium acridum]|uniref:uncharacterized protein n=1 Tax=Metarhizium acridum TaxID=92637 RepID=UPI001C6B4932|nr:hypothetical protein J3458_000784 [Metarhizium acridum]
MGNEQSDVGVATGGCGVPWWVPLVLRNRPLGQLVATMSGAPPQLRLFLRREAAEPLELAEDARSLALALVTLVSAVKVFASSSSSMSQGMPSLVLSSLLNSLKIKFRVVHSLKVLGIICY